MKESTLKIQKLIKNLKKYVLINEPMFLFNIFKITIFTRKISFINKDVFYNW